MPRLPLVTALTLLASALPAYPEAPKVPGPKALEASLCANLCQLAQYTELSTADKLQLGLCRAAFPCSNGAVPRSVYHFIPWEQFLDSMKNEHKS
jgi:hypothetical protein